jgi:SprT protein
MKPDQFLPDHRSRSRAPLLDPNQLEFNFSPPRAINFRGCDFELEAKAREILDSLGANALGQKLRVEWNARLRSAAGRADSRHATISLNPLLQEHGTAEIDRTFRHELAHLLAQFRAGRRRVSAHGTEWRAACRDLGIGDEARCHTLPFPVRSRAPRFIYKCPNCRSTFPRVRRIRRTVACLACCRAHNRGKFDGRFRLRLVEAKSTV